MNWREQYVSILNSQRDTQAILNETEDLKRLHFPAKLYRYREFNNKNHDQALREGKIYLATPSGYNDPYDSAYITSAREITNSYYRHALRECLSFNNNIAQFTDDEIEAIEKADDPIAALGKKSFEKAGIPLPENFHEGLADILTLSLGQSLGKTMEFMRGSLRICCFSENPSSILMWSHYADYHKGYCLEYDTIEWTRQTMPLRLFHPVHYTEVRYDATQHWSPPNKPSVHTMIAAACTKSLDWAYEKEWRFVAPGGAAERKPWIDWARPQRIILGAKCDPAERKRLEVVPMLKGVPIVQARLSATAFKIDVP